MTTTTHAGRFWLSHTELVAQAVERLGRTLAASRGEAHGQKRLAQTAGSLAAHGIGVSIRRRTQRDWWAKEMLTLRVTLRCSGEGQRAHELTLRWKEEQRKAAMEWGSEPQRGGESDGADEQWCDPTGIRPDVWLGSDSTPGAQVPSTEQALARLNGLREIADLLRPIGKPEAALANQLRLDEIETVSETMAETCAHSGPGRSETASATWENAWPRPAGKWGSSTERTTNWNGSTSAARRAVERGPTSSGEQTGRTANGYRAGRRSESGCRRSRSS